MSSDIAVKTLPEFVAAVTNLGPGIYRGQPEDFPLLPGIIRPYLDRARERNPKLERTLLERFRLNAAPYLSGLEDTSLAGWWRCLALAQHHRLPTRLLDWTTSPLAALYFATEGYEGRSTEPVVYVLSRPEPLTAEEFARQFDSPPWKYEHESLLFLQPDLMHPRVLAQGSLFSVHPGVPVDRWDARFYEEQVRRIVIPKSAVREVIGSVYRFGFTRARLFQDPEAVSQTLVWEARGEMDRLPAEVVNPQRS